MRKTQQQRNTPKALAPTALDRVRGGSTTYTGNTFVYFITTTTSGVGGLVPVGPPPPGPGGGG